MSRRLRILFLGGAKRVAIARDLIEAGRRRGIDVEIFGYELDPRVPLACVGKILTGCRWSDPALFESLEKAVAEHGIDMMLPFVDGAIEVVARFVGLHPEVAAPVSSPKIAVTFFDKVLAAKAFDAVGIPVPLTASAVPDSFPVIAKPRCGSASKGIMVIADRAQWDEAAIDLKEYLVQEYVADRTEITADCYVSRSGEILAVSPRIRLETAGGEAVRTVTIADPDVVALGEKVLTAFSFRGAVTIQFIRDNASGRLMVMEINPRLGGGVVASVNAGADIAQLIVDEWAGLPLSRLSARPDVLTVRYLQDVVFFPDENEQ